MPRKEVTKQTKPPKGERVWTTYKTADGNTYITTSRERDRELFFFYRLVDGVWEKLGKSKTPLDLERKYINQQKRT